MHFVFRNIALYATYLDLSFSEQEGLNVSLYNFLHLVILFKSPALIQGSCRNFLPQIVHVVSGTNQSICSTSLLCTLLKEVFRSLTTISLLKFVLFKDHFSTSILCLHRSLDFIRTGSFLCAVMPDSDSILGRRSLMLSIRTLQLYLSYVIHTDNNVINQHSTGFGYPGWSYYRR